MATGTTDVCNASGMALTRLEDKWSGTNTTFVESPDGVEVSRFNKSL